MRTPVSPRPIAYRCVLCGKTVDDSENDNTPCWCNPLPHSPHIKSYHEFDPIYPPTPHP